MGSRIVTSPAGQDIEVVDDQDWCQAAGVAINSLKQFNGSKPYAIAELWLGGAVRDPKSGRAAAMLWDRIYERFPGADLPAAGSFSGLTRAPQNSAAFEIITNGKRTQLINLVAMPERWFTKLQAFIPKPIEKEPMVDELAGQSALVDGESINLNGSQVEDRSEITDEDLERLIGLDAPTVYDIQPPLELSIASQVAMSLLTTCVEIITAGSSESIDERVRKLTTDIADVQSKLSMRLQENDVLRRQNRQAGDEIIALRAERDGLRSRLRATEANLTAALKGDAVAAVNGEIQRRVDAIMRTAPTKKGDD